MANAKLNISKTAIENQQKVLPIINNQTQALL